MVTINSSILLIALPNIFLGIHLDPLIPSSTSYLLWLIMSFIVVTAVLVVSLGRVGDMFGRVRMYNIGFAIFTVFSILLSVTWLQGPAGALWLILMRVGQGVGGAFLFANSSAIITDAFPHDQRGLALGINGVAAIGGSFIGLILGGLLGPVDWRLVFLVSVPFGVFGTFWAYWKLQERGLRVASVMDWWGNVTFAVGLVAVLVGITYGIEPYGGQTMGWTNPLVLAALIGGVVILVIFGVVETRVAAPMFRLHLFRIRAFAAGNLASLLASLGRGGLMLMLIIWLQGIWLPLHGYAFSQTPLWAGIYMLPLTAGFLLAGPASGFLSDRFGARPFATGGMVLAAASFFLLERLPVDFPYLLFALLIFLNGLAMGLFASPNRAGIMNSLPADQRGAGAGMAATFQNSAMVLSIGIFFSLMILGLAGSLPASLYHGLTAQGVPKAAAARVAGLPPVGSLFAALLGYNPIQTLLGPQLHHLPHARVAYLTGRSFFPSLIAGPFSRGLGEAFDFAAVLCLIAAVASWLRGGKFHYGDGALASAEPVKATPVPALAAVGTPDAAPAAASRGAGWSPPGGAGDNGHPWPDQAHQGGVASQPVNGSQGSNGSRAQGSDGSQVGAPTSAETGLAWSAERGMLVGARRESAPRPAAPMGWAPVPAARGSSIGTAAGSTPVAEDDSVRTPDPGPEPADRVEHPDHEAGRAAHDRPDQVPDLLERDGESAEEESMGVPEGDPGLLAMGAVLGPAGTTHGDGQPRAGQGVGAGAAALGGSVSSVGGSPLEGATITLTGEGGRQAGRAVSGPDGAYRLEVGRPGAYTAIVAAAGFRPVAATIAVGLGRAVQDFVLVGSGAVAGLVRTGSGVAVRAIVVTLTDGGGQTVGEPVETDDQGHFSLAGVPEGSYTVTATVSGHQPAVAAVTVRAGEEAHVELALVGAGELSGVVRAAANGTPLAGATVTLVDGQGQVVRAVVTSEDGSYAFTDLPGAGYTVVASGYQPVATTVEVEAGGRQVADLNLGGAAQ
ncbi:MAG: MFS transporter [Acidimicrobiales bacterium]